MTRPKTTREALKPGTVAKAYGYDSADNLFDGERVTVVKEEGEGVYKIQHVGKHSLIHRRNLVRLVAKKRRDFWLVRSPRNGTLQAHFSADALALLRGDEPAAEVIHVREVGRKRKGGGG